MSIGLSQHSEAGWLVRTSAIDDGHQDYRVSRSQRAANMREERHMNMEWCMGDWEGDHWVHVSCPYVEVMGDVPHSPHEFDVDEYDPADEFS